MHHFPTFFPVDYQRASFPPAPSGSALDLVVIAGQSNARGNGDSDLATEAGLGAAYANVQEMTHIDLTGGAALSWTDTGPRDLQPRVANGECGIELKMMRVLDAAQPLRWACAKGTVDSTSINVHWDPAGSYPAGDPLGNLFTQVVAFIRAAEAAMGARLRHLTWIQGEGDAGGEAAADAYLVNLTAFVAALRAEFGSGWTFHFIRLNDACTQTFTTTVRTAQEQYVIDDATSVMYDTDDLVLTDQGGTFLHYDTDSLYAIGERIAATILGTATLSTLTVTPDAQTIGDTPLQHNAYGVYNNGARRNLTADAVWASSNEAVATVDQNGLVTPVANGTTTISATIGAVNDGTVVTVAGIPEQPVIGTPASSTTSATPAWPAHQAGDRLWYVCSSATATALATPAGMTELATDSPEVIGTSLRLQVFYKDAASSSETAPAVAVGASNHVHVVPVRTRGHSATIDAQGSSNSGGTGVLTFGWPDITAVAAATRILLFSSWSIDSAGPLCVDDSITNAGLTNIVEHYDGGTTDGNGSGVVIASAERTSAGAIGATTATSSSSILWCSIAIALAPP